MVNDMPPLKIRRLEGKDIVESSSSSAASDGSPLPHSLILPPEVWANVIDCECICFSIYVEIDACIVFNGISSFYTKSSHTIRSDRVHKLHMLYYIMHYH